MNRRGFFRALVGGVVSSLTVPRFSRKVYQGSVVFSMHELHPAAWRYWQAQPPGNPIAAALMREKLKRAWETCQPGGELK